MRFMVEFDLELDISTGQFDQQYFVEWLAQELGVSVSSISAEVTPIDVRRRLATERRRPNGTSTLSSGGPGLKLEVTIQVPQELNTGLGDASNLRWTRRLQRGQRYFGRSSTAS